MEDYEASVAATSTTKTATAEEMSAIFDKIESADKSARSNSKTGNGGGDPRLNGQETKGRAKHVDDDDIKDAVRERDFLALCVKNLHDKDALASIASRAVAEGLTEAFERDLAVAPSVFATISALRCAAHKLTPTRYEVEDDGSVFVLVTVGKGNKARQELKRICSPLILIASGSQRDGSGWKLWVRVRTKSKGFTDLMLDRSDLVARGEWVRKIHDAGGTVRDPGALLDLLLFAEAPGDVRVVTQTGWQNPGVWTEFVHGQDLLSIDGSTAVAVEGGEDMTPGGTLEDWKQEVAKLAVGNQTMAFRMLNNVAASWKRPMGVRSGGSHLYRKSSRGKTTSGYAGCSVGFGPQHYKTWDLTPAAFYKIAQLRNDQVVAVDDTSQAAKPDYIRTISYASGNGQESARSKSDGKLRETGPEFCIEFQSDGECSIPLIFKLAGIEYLQGQESRVPNIPFHEATNHCGEPDGAAFARRVEEAAKRHYGWALRETVRHCMDAGHRKWVKTRMDEIRSRLVEPEHDGQVHRVTERFALAGAVGELEIRLGLLPWATGYAEQVAMQAFQDWIKARGGTQSSDLIEGPRNLVSYFFRYRESRFQPTGKNVSEILVMQRMGFRQKVQHCGRVFEEFSIPCGEKQTLREMMGVTDTQAVLEGIAETTSQFLTSRLGQELPSDADALPEIMLVTPRTSKLLAGAPLTGDERGLSWKRQGQKRYCFLVPSALTDQEEGDKLAENLDSEQQAAVANRDVPKARR